LPVEVAASCRLLSIVLSNFYAQVKFFFQAQFMGGGGAKRLFRKAFFAVPTLSSFFHLQKNFND